jgi:outer membrane protein assembly factor BamB/pimeloyl-ACP methyl ester carboxylesterase
MARGPRLNYGESRPAANQNPRAFALCGGSRADNIRAVRKPNRLPRIAICSLQLAAVVVFAADQPQWGARFSRNMVSEEKGLPDGFDPATGRNIRWTARLGTQTYSTPVVAGGRVLIGTNNDAPRDPRHKGDRGVLMCFDEKDGRLCWQLVCPKITTSNYWDWPRDGLCSPATVEGDRVYVVSNRGEVMCLDLRGMANGNDGPYRDEARHCSPADEPPIEPGATDADILWLFDMIKEQGVRQHDSAHCSILLHGDFLYVNTSNGLNDAHNMVPAPDAPSLIVLDKNTGRLVARDNERIGPLIFHSTWSSPALGEVGGRPLVFFGGGDGVVYAFEALKTAPPAGEVAALKRVWRFDCDPTAPKTNVHQYIRNREVSPSNIKSMPVFHDNRVYVTVGGDVWWGKNQAWLKCIDATRTGDITRDGEVWSYPLDRHSMCTPSVWGGMVFVADSGRKIHCVDAATGKPVWVHETRGDSWASTLAADGKVYAATRNGEVWILATSREKQVLGCIDMDSPIHGSPVAANGVLYVATMKNLYALKTENPGFQPPEDVSFKAAVDGTEQRYVLMLPQGFDATKTNHVLIALHGHGSDRWQYARQDRGECKGARDAAARHGMIFVSPDYRGNSWMGPQAEADVAQIIAELRARFKIGKVILAGGSMGGTSALTFAALHPELVDGVCSQNGLANFLGYHQEAAGIAKAIVASFGGTETEQPAEYRRRSAEFHAEKFTMPVAITTGGRDTSVPPASALRLAEAIKKHNPRVLVIHRPETGHTTSYEDTVAALEFVINAALGH